MKGKPAVDVVLVGVQPSGRSIPIAIKRSRTVFGRQTDCHIRIPANDVSRNHCEVVVEDGEISIADMGSRNGTFVNKEKVSKRDLEPGDIITIGPGVFVVQVDGMPSDIDAAAAFKQGAMTPGEPGSVARADDTRTTGGGGLLDEVAPSFDPDDSSVVEFEFDLDDDEDDQPPL